MRKMTPGERFMRCISFQSVDRIPVMDFGYWPETIEEWHQQGLPLDVKSTEQVEAYFGCDRGFETNLVNYFGDNGPVGIEWGIWPPFSKILVEETEETYIYEGECGHIIEHKFSGSMAYQGRYPIETMEDFLTKVPSRMDPWDPTRVQPGFGAMLRRGKEQGQAVGLWIDGYLAWPRILMGIENLSYTYYDDPELIHAIQRQHTEFIKGYVDMVLTKTKLEYACFFEDMAYSHGALVSPTIFREFMMPYYHELIPFLKSRGIQKILVDSDGNTVELSDLLVEAGVDGHYPLEINSGSRPELLRARHPKLALIGGIDKLTLMRDRSDIDRELAKLPHILEQGGFIPCLDHRVQPGVSMANYQYYIDQKRRILEKYCY